MPKTKRILVIDDSETMCMSMKARLEENGDYEVQTETKGNLALAAAYKFKPDLIVLDLLMPDLDGVSVAIHLHDDLATKDIPVLFLTAIARDEDISQHGDIFGGYQVVPKSVSTEKFIEAVEKNIAKGR